MRVRRSDATASTSTAVSPGSGATKQKSCAVKKRKSSSNTSGPQRMEVYDHFYNKFERPPLAPIYYPTPEEFQDPIEYVAKIRGEAEKYGTVKIVPPSTFKPPFAIDKDNFIFTPRVQKLNEIEALVKEKQTFLERLYNYNRMSGHPYELPVDKDGNVIDLHRLHRIVQNFGGCFEVNEEEKWKDVAKEMTTSSRPVPNAFVNLLKNHYNTYVEPFIRNVKERALRSDDESDDEMEELKQKYQHHHGTSISCSLSSDDDGPVSMQGGKRRVKKKSSQNPRPTRMMAGGVRKQSSPRKTRRSKQTDDPMDLVYCITCHEGNDEHLLLVCDIEDCKNGRHTYCCDPPLNEIPQGEWRCPQCIQAEDAKIGLDWGFYDSDQQFSINSFAAYADKFKCDFFGVKNAKDVPCEEVEAAYWKNLIATSDPVSVKYGADLISNKVGSGFPRKEDRFTGPDAKLKAHYANHAWNLNNLPILKESVLSHVDHDISGMVVPWVYVGMCFSTFCWHTEDHWTYSINYNHFGERKIWYGVGGDDAEKFEDALRKIAPGLTGRSRDLFHHMTTAANPALLRSMGVPIYTVHQNPGEFVITFPRSYHSGYNEGLNFAEAVNFAPIDWLSKGRLCIDEYASVRRYCVFSHEELVFNMVDAREKLGISMSVAALDELMEISKREQHLRLMVNGMGFTQQEHVPFEQLNDEQRTCRFCRTTLFLSAITCEHERIVCLQHYDHLCKTCTYADCTLQIRYELEDLIPFIDQLETRTTEYHAWKLKTDHVLHEGDKPELDQVEELVDLAKQNHYPMTSHMNNLVNIRNKARSAIEKANHILYGKVRTRVGTRIQRADNRLDVDGLREFIDELRTMPCNMDEIADKLEEFLQQVSEWQTLSKSVLSKEDDKKCALIDIQELINKGEEFNVKLEEIKELRKELDISEWRTKTLAIINWKPYDGMELEKDFSCIKRWTSQEVMDLLKEGARIFNKKPSDELNELQTMLKRAHIHDSDAETFFEEDPKIENLASVWKKVRESDWFSEKNIDELREEFQAVELIKHRFGIDFVVENKKPDGGLAMFNDKQMRICDIVEMKKIVEHSSLLADSPITSEIRKLKDEMEILNRKVAKLFKPQFSYYNLYDIISERNDLAEVVRNGNTPLNLQSVNTSAKDEWAQVSCFESIEEMLDHQTSLKNSYNDYMTKLETTNGNQEKEICVCLGTPTSKESSSEIECLLCNAKYHVKCSEWTIPLNDLPDGIFLCVRCRRGRRPIIEDVSAIIANAPKNFFEVNIIKSAIEKTHAASRAFLSAVETWNPHDLGSVLSAARFVLSCEIVDLNIQPKLNQLASTIFRQYIDNNSSAYAVLRENQSSTKIAPSSIFAFRMSPTARRSGKRNSSQITREPSKKTRKRSKQKNDEQLCSAEVCLQPMGKFNEGVRWIMCDIGCERWFHCTCVQLTDEMINDLTEYRCKKCEASSGSPSSTSGSSI
ncbi:unnamed protein product [Caenorhabditis bovis]|uniref:[histone H3]-trimethyl-L-lysine(4) demethylase n=1 Tax=Caenorhabditis bovis TaxID=2654633 RepID=A0A8S1F7H7_9PELO|nr:unnamed protein product [Caenorhabditis bovis]